MKANASVGADRCYGEQPRGGRSARKTTDGLTRGRDLIAMAWSPRFSETSGWREGRDSNPRGSFTPPTRLAGGCFRPLSHLPGESGPSFDSIATPDFHNSMPEQHPLSYLAPDGGPRRSGRAPDVGAGPQDGFWSG